MESLEACALACTKEPDCTTFFYKVLYVVIYKWWWWDYSFFCKIFLYVFTFWFNLTTLWNRNRPHCPVNWERRQNYKQRVASQEGGVLKVIFSITLQIFATYKFIKIPESFCQALCSGALFNPDVGSLLGPVKDSVPLRCSSRWNILKKCFRNSFQEYFMNIFWFHSRIPSGVAKFASSR